MVAEVIVPVLLLLVGRGVAVPLQDDSLVTTVTGPDVTTPLTSTFNSVPLLPEGLTLPLHTKKDDKPDVYSLHVTSRIQYRYASTIVSSRVANTANKSREVVFSFVLPDTAFITGFLMEIDGKAYKANVKEKEVAKKEYDEAIKGGQTAGHVAQSARNSNRFTVSVNVESRKKVTFNLTYEELLKRELSVYNHAVNIDPGQIVQDMAVKVFINESSPITTLEVTDLRDSNAIDYEKTSNNKLAVIKRPSNTTADILWAPSDQDQREMNEEGVKGQLVVRYDVDRASHPEQILVNEGYFVHFFSPSDLPTLRKHVTFVLDVSYSMAGRKIVQLRDAMKVILNDLNKDDYFSLVVFYGEVKVWEPETDVVLHSYYSGANQEETELRDTAVVPATAENIKKAQDFVKGLSVYPSTNIYGALVKGLEVAQLGKKLTVSDDENKPEPIMIFMTDGEPNAGESDPEKIASIVTDKNKMDGVSIFALAFGEYADWQFLKKLALRNSGFARKIYEASDSELQLRDFYRLVSSPLLAKVAFNYTEGQVEEGTLSQTNFSTFFSGSELVVSGKLKSSDLTGHLTAKTANGMTYMPFAPLTVVPFPDRELVAHHRPERNYSDASFMERLWAYLTIQQLLDKEAAETLENTSITSPSKEKALDLALKYGFVTPLTSLVVVKPNETVSADTEKGDVPGKNFNNMFPIRSTLPLLEAVGSFEDFPLGEVQLPADPCNPRPLGYFGASSKVPVGLQRCPISALHTPPPGVPYSTRLRSGNRISPTKPLALEIPNVIPVHSLTWLASASNATHVTLHPDPSRDAETLLLGLNQTDEAFSYCSSPQGEGHCRYLSHCALDTFIDNIVSYYSYFCKIDMYAGVCCPDSVKPITVV